ncbi:hypothetical protein SAY86_006751 [Trapa natans]|uniref:Uncharacterized protein n=1 Tax=Trapa natans TaxID=22666 RepID=A0AAN7QXX4_TRANT|nr:hypothetical protein SAY86_006751 [Trapa natans]
MLETDQIVGLGDWIGVEGIKLKEGLGKFGSEVPGKCWKKQRQLRNRSEWVVVYLSVFEGKPDLDNAHVSFFNQSHLKSNPKVYGQMPINRKLDPRFSSGQGPGTAYWRSHGLSKWACYACSRVQKTDPVWHLWS